MSATAPPPSPKGDLIRLPLAIQKLNRDGAEKPRPFEVIGIAYPDEPLTLSAEVILKAGNYRVTDPHLPRRDWRFVLSGDLETSILTRCGHRTKTPTRDEWFFAYSAKGDVVAGSTDIHVQKCCRGDFVHYDPNEPPNTYALGIFQPLTLPRRFLVDERHTMTVKPGEYLVLNPNQTGARPPTILSPRISGPST